MKYYFKTIVAHAAKQGNQPLLAACPKRAEALFLRQPFIRSGFNPNPGRAVTSLDKTLHDDYLFLVALTSSKLSGY